MKIPAIILLAIMPFGSGFNPVSHDKLRQRVFNNTLLSIFKVSHQIQDPNSPTGVGNTYCTAFIVDAAKGLALTVRHCIPNDDAPLYVLKYSKSKFEQPFLSEVVKKDDYLALIKIPVMSGPPVEFADDVQLFDEVIGVGYGFGEMKAMKRNVAAFEGGDVLIDGALLPGMSGGPTVDLEGKVVLINQAAAPGVATGCGAKEMKDFIKSK